MRRLLIAAGIAVCLVIAAHAVSQFVASVIGTVTTAFQRF